MEERLAKIMAGCFWKTRRQFIGRGDSRNRKFDDQKTNKVTLERLVNQGRRMSRILAEDDNSQDKEDLNYFYKLYTSDTK